MKLALGTVQFGMQYGICNTNIKTEKADLKKILECAFNNNINVIDTASDYGYSEQRLGDIGVKRFSIVTKLPIEINCDEEDWVQNSFKSSLKKLGLKKIYGLLFHRTSHLVDFDGLKLSRAICRLKEEGLVSKIGISIYNPEELNYIPKEFKLDIVQSPLNIFDQRLISSGWLDILYNRGVEIHVRSAFLQGLLLMKPNELPESFAPWIHLFEEWHSWLISNKISAIEGCLAFLNNPKISQVVFGAVTIEQLQEILIASKVSGPSEFPNISCGDEDLINPSNWKF